MIGKIQAIKLIYMHIKGKIIIQATIYVYEICNINVILLPRLTR